MEFINMLNSLKNLLIFSKLTLSFILQISYNIVLRPSRKRIIDTAE